MSQPQELRRAKIDGHIWFEMMMPPPHAMAGSKYYACKGKESTAVMPANFEANIIQIVPTSIVPPTHEQALQRLAAAEAVLKLAQEAKAAASDKLAAAQRDDYAATQELEKASAAVKSAQDVCDATKRKTKHELTAGVSKEDIQICKDHGDSTETAAQKTWILADIKVTESKKDGKLCGDAVGEFLNVEGNPNGGGFANLHFEQEELKKGRVFKGVICGIKLYDHKGAVNARPFAFILASVGERRGSVFVGWDETKWKIEQGQVVTFEIQAPTKGKVNAENMKVIEGCVLKKHQSKAPNPQPKKIDRERTPPVAPAAGGAPAPHTKRPPAAGGGGGAAPPHTKRN